MKQEVGFEERLLGATATKNENLLEKREVFFSADL